MSIEIIKPYTSQYPDPICFEANVEVQVQRGDPEFPGWFWCRAESGREGWVHHSFLAASTGITRSTRAYSASELTVTGGERGVLIQLLDGWMYIQLADGNEGWIPERHVRLF
jgi:SH3-like domain-containing protein